MPAIKFISNGLQALDLHNTTLLFTGDAEQTVARVKVRKKILAAWPELEEQGSTAEEEAARVQRMAKDKREIEISTTEQTALAEGMLGFMKDRTVNDAQKEAGLGLAKLCKFAGWLDTQIGKGQIREFTESDEAVVADPVPA